MKKFPAFLGKGLCVFLLGASVLAPFASSEEAWEKQRKQDVRWANDVVVNLCPARSFTKTWEDDAKRRKLFEDFDPDSLDFWSGTTMNAGDFFRNRGVAVSARQANEYDAHILDTAAHGRFFYENGIAVREDGKLGRYVDEQYNGEYGANPATERWNHMLEQHMFRMSQYADIYFQDNICNSLSALGVGFEDSMNAQFVDYLKKKYDERKLRSMGLSSLDTFNIRDETAAARRRTKASYYAGSNLPKERAEALIREPLIHEFIRFSTIRQMEVWKDLTTNARRYAWEKGRPIPVFEGNQAGMAGKRVLATIQTQSSDIAWVEAAVFLQPSFGDARQAESTANYKVAHASGLYQKPVRVVQYPDTRFSEEKRMPAVLYGAEAYANGGVPVWAYTFSLHNKGDLDAPVYSIYKDFIRFVHQRRELFVDRERMADTAVVLSLPSLFWRQFSSLTTQTPHTKHFLASARLLEDNHRPWEALVFGYPELFDDTEVLARLERYRMVVLPEVDAVSDKQVAALTNFVRKGGALVLWGRCGVNDEELMPRKQAAFEALIDNPGKGKVVRIDQDETEAYSNVAGSLLPLGQQKKEPVPWKYTFDNPGDNWYTVDFDDVSWKQGATPFGSSFYGTRSKTPWPVKSIWMRKDFSLEEIPQTPCIHFMQQGVQVVWRGAETEVPGDGLDVYINGVFAGMSKTRWSGVHSLPLNSAAKSALKKGRNVVAVRSQQSNIPKQIIDVGLVEYAPDDALIEKLALSEAVFESDSLNRDVWINVFRHGNGPMHTVHFVNYSFDPGRDRLLPQKHFTIRLKLNKKDVEALTEAWMENLDGEKCEVPFRRIGADVLECAIPGVDTWGILVLHGKEEREARRLAAEIRKWRNRLHIASRRNGPEQRAILPDLERAEISAYPPDRDFARYVGTAGPLAEQLERRMDDLEKSLENRPALDPDRWLQADAVRKFDFGKAGAAPGWTEVHSGMRYFAKRGFGWTSQVPNIVDKDQKAPDDLLRDFITVRYPAEYLSGIALTGNRAFPLSHPPTFPGTFRVDLPNGRYVAAVVSGSKEATGNQSDQMGVSTCCVDVDETPCLHGVPLCNGRWNTRAFPFVVSNGKVEFTFYGEYTGPYFHNNMEWLVNALAVFEESKVPEDLRSRLSTREKRLGGLIRDWKLLGPFPDPEWKALATPHPAESPLDWGGAYRGRWGNGNLVRWFDHKTSDPLGVVFLHRFFDERNGNGRVAEGCFALAHAEFESAEAGSAILYGSFSARGSIFLNGEKILHQPAVRGLLEEDFRIRVNLKKGKNGILLKLLHTWGGPWKFHVGIVDSKGKAIIPSK